MPFDRQTYQELIPRHLYDLARSLDCIVTQLANGGFAARLSATDWRGGALDECHEMKINRDAKVAVIRPKPERMRYIANYLPFRAMCINNLKSQLLPETKNREYCFTASSRDKAINVNTDRMLKELKCKGKILIGGTNKGLLNFLTDVHATSEQSHDLLNFRSIGQRSFENFVNYRLLQKASTEAPERKKRLLTFSLTESGEKRIKLVEKERRISQRLLKRQLVWLTENKYTPSTNGDMFAPISCLPKAIVGKDGLPYKSNKSSTTKYLMKRYEHLPVVYTRLPWTPTTVILEGMFMIQSAPLSMSQTMKEYATMLFLRYVKFHFRSGTVHVEVHVVFDNSSESPKEIEQARRDQAKGLELANHCCETTINSTTLVPDKWRSFLSCRAC